MTNHLQCTIFQLPRKAKRISTDGNVGSTFHRSGILWLSFKDTAG